MGLWDCLLARPSSTHREDGGRGCSGPLDQSSIPWGERPADHARAISTPSYNLYPSPSPSPYHGLSLPSPSFPPLPAQPLSAQPLSATWLGQHADGDNIKAIINTDKSRLCQCTVYRCPEHTLEELLWHEALPQRTQTHSPGRFRDVPKKDKERHPEKTSQHCLLWGGLSPVCYLAGLLLTQSHIHH